MSDTDDEDIEIEEDDRGTISARMTESGKAKLRAEGYGMGVADERRAARLLVAAVLAYDEALRSCGNDPSRMASFCSAQGHTLDALYGRMTSVARTMERQSPTPGVSPTVIDVSDALLE